MKAKPIFVWNEFTPCPCHIWSIKEFMWEHEVYAIVESTKKAAKFCSGRMFCTSCKISNFLDLSKTTRFFGALFLLRFLMPSWRELLIDSLIILSFIGEWVRNLILNQDFALLVSVNVALVNLLNFTGIPTLSNMLSNPCPSIEVDNQLMDTDVLFPYFLYDLPWSVIVFGRDLH